MFYFIHILAGAAIAEYFPHLLPIVILSLLSHFLIDIIPHRDNLTNIKLTRKSYNQIKITNKAILLELSDILIGLILIAAIYLKFSNILMLIGIFFSLFPDIIKIIYFTPLKRNKLFIEYMHFHSIIQMEVGWVIGILTQLIVAIILFKLLF